VTVVTPSYNQASFIEETIRSVLLQGYPDLEYIVMDGGSTDGSVEIIRKYEPWLTYWTSGKDSGQTAAINDGLSRATGQVVAYLNSDDVYEPGTLEHAGQVFAADAPPLVYSNFRCCDSESAITNEHEVPDFDLQRLMLDNYIPQQTVFIRRDVWDAVGPFDAGLHFTMDYDFWLRACAGGHYPCRQNRTYARFRLHPESKTESQEYLFWCDIILVLERLFESAQLQEDMLAMRNRALSRVQWRAAGCAFRDSEIAAAERHVELAVKNYEAHPNPSELDLALAFLTHDREGGLLPPARARSVWRKAGLSGSRCARFRSVLDEEYVREALNDVSGQGLRQVVTMIMALLIQNPGRVAMWRLRRCLADAVRHPLRGSA
jgi:glycosyltransferase involved in cell wall biosynthesis